MTDSDSAVWHPTTDDVLSVHDEIIDEYPNSESGVRDESQLRFITDFVEHGHFGKVPTSIHEKAFHLLRLLATNHPFVDGNKRTALNVTAAFFSVNGYRFDYGDDARVMLKLLGIRQDLLDETATAEYLSERTEVETSRENPTVQNDKCLLDMARQDRDAHRDIYDALANE